MPRSENNKKAPRAGWLPSLHYGDLTEELQHLPNFFIVGPPRTGTSWLHEVLARHTVLPERIKETRFFDQHFHRGIHWYLAYYPRCNGNCRIGEVAPTYFASERARQRIKDLVPDAKIVCTFRDPVQRILSLYRVKRAYGMLPWDFDQALLRDPELIESSRYATYLRMWQQAFGTENVLPTLYDDLRDSPQAYVRTIADFIGIPRFMLSAAEQQSLHSSDSMTHPRSYLRTRGATKVADWLKSRHCGGVVSVIKGSPLKKLFLGGGLPFSGISRELSLTVQQLFCREVEELEEIMQRDLSAWKPSYAAGTPGTIAA